MPAKNTIKAYVANSYYHLYNRGIDRRAIFLEEQDCVVFLYYIKLYLSTPEALLADNLFVSPKLVYKINNLNLSEEVSLLSFALMPNHFHLQVKQSTENGIEKFMRRLLTSYVQYFNRKYKRRGPLFESTYKAVMTTTESQHVYLSSYIHRNPMKLINPPFDFVQFSSYQYYLNQKHATWLKPTEILSYFSRVKNIAKNDVLSYQSFVENFEENPEIILQELMIEVD